MGKVIEPDTEDVLRRSTHRRQPTDVVEIDRWRRAERGNFYVRERLADDVCNVANVGTPGEGVYWTEPAFVVTEDYEGVVVDLDSSKSHWRSITSCVQVKNANGR